MKNSDSVVIQVETGSKKRELLKFFEKLRSVDIDFEEFKKIFEEEKIDPNLYLEMSLFSQVCICSNMDKKKKIEYLLQQGANPNIQDMHPSLFKNTAAHHLIANEAYDHARYIIDTAANYTKQDINIRDSEGKTLLLMAIKLHHTETAQYLIDLGADITIPDNQGRTPLHMAAIIGNVAIFSALLEKNADIDGKDNSGRTPMDYLAMAKEKRKEIMQSTFKEIGVESSRDENAKKNAIIDEYAYSVERIEKLQNFTFSSTKKSSNTLLTMIKNENTNLDYLGNKEFIINQIEAFTGRSVEDACLYEQGQLFYKHKEEVIEGQQTVRLLNTLLEKNNVPVFFNVQKKLYMDMVVDAVMVLPENKKLHKEIIEKVTSLLPETIKTHQYLSQGKVHLMISEINTPHKNKALWLHTDKDAGKRGYHM